MWGPFGLLVTIGCKAGLLLAVVPDEARSPEYPVAVSASLLLANWTERIYTTDPDGAMVSDGYPVPGRVAAGSGCGRHTHGDCLGTRWRPALPPAARVLESGGDGQSPG